MNASRQPDPSSPASAPQSRAAFARLHALRPVGLRADACLNLHKAYVGCRHCIAACPHASLELQEGTLVLDPAQCSGCGLCAASCPTGALAVEGCARPAPAAGAAPVLACARAATGTATQPVPCLGALTVNDYLRLALACDGAPIRLVDDGACERCPTAAGRGNPAWPVVAAARRALAAAGVPEHAQPQWLARRALPNGNPSPALRESPAVAGRRAFFAGLSRAASAGVAQALPLAAPAAPATLRAREPIPHVRGEEARLLLAALARRHGRPAPATADLPQLAASASCRAHGTCVRACPSGALTLEREGATATLRFDPWQCMACGACERLCPEGALSLAAAGPRPLPAHPEVLAIVPEGECARCGAPVHGAPQDTLCERCSKSARLARAGFGLFHPPHGEPAASPDPPRGTGRCVEQQEQSQSQFQGGT